MLQAKLENAEAQRLAGRGKATLFLPFCRLMQVPIELQHQTTSVRGQVRYATTIACQKEMETAPLQPENPIANAWMHWV